MDYNPTDFKDKPDLSTPLRAVELNKFGAGIVEGITKAELALPLVDTAANLAASNPIPAVGRGVRESDTGRWKTGDGTTHYNDLPYDADVVAGDVAGHKLSRQQAFFMYPDGLTSDFVHPGALGHKMIASVLLNAIRTHPAVADLAAITS